MVFTSVKLESEIPENAIKLNRAEAVAYQRKLLESWKPQSQVFIARYGNGILTACTVIPSVIINSAIRQRLKLMQIGTIPTLMGTVLSPATFLFLTNSLVVQEEILLLRGQTCPMCLEIKSIIVQNSLGVLYPYALSLVCNYSIAFRFSTLRLPNVTDWRALLRSCFSMTKSMTGILAYTSLFHTVASSFVTYKAIQSVMGVQDYLKMMDEQEEEMMLNKSYQ